MATASKGLYVQRLSSGEIYSVQIIDSAGMKRPMKPQAYIRQGIMPPIESLPDIENYCAP